MNAKHRGGRRSWRRRVPGVLVAVLAAASALGVASAALRGTGTDTAAAGAAGAALTLSGGGVARARRHRGHHRVASANPPAMTLQTDAQLQPVRPAIAVAMSTPPLPAEAITSWGPPAAQTIDLRWAAPVAAAPSLFLVPQGAIASADGGITPASSADADWEPDPMVDTVPHPVVKLFPLSALEPDLASGSIDDRVFAAFDAERRHLDAAALAGGRHASPKPTDAASPRNAAYRSKHSA